MSLPTATLIAQLAAALAASCAWLVAACADDGPAFTVYAENDVFAGEDGSYTDRHYSAGQYGFHRRAEGRVSPWARRTLAPLSGGGDGALHESWGFGSALFTPEDIRRVEPDPADRPYAGWLRFIDVLSRAHDGTVDTVSLDVGWVGPAALGKQIQRAFHHAIEEKDPRGWDSQLENEIAVHVALERKWPRWERDVGRLQLDVRPKAQLTLGNTFVNAGGGVEARLGTGLGDDYGLPRLGPANPYPGFAHKAGAGCACYLYVGVEGRYVARDLFIEGNSFGGVRTGLELKPWVADYQVGATIDRGRWSVSFTHVLRTEEFVGQRRSQQFGLVSVTRRH